ncbi:MAG: DUF3137 domain-containing protein [Bacteroidales bacterium]|nr:DUF3137 domain-containing protein [Bacteroidales bacterium]
MLVTIGGYGLSTFQKKQIEAEQKSIRRIIHTLFPKAKLSLGLESVSSSLISKSNLFGTNNVQSISFGRVSFNHSQQVVFHDLLVGSSHTNWFTQTSIGGFFYVIKMMFKGVFSKRAENVVGNFRGLFAEAKMDKKINGTVIVLPDHLEKHLDYLAKNIQTLKNTKTNKLVKLEDIEFEHYFAVYSSDEITARYVLTPAMMRRMTELKKRYNRDIMFSFNKDHFFFAVSMPEGFLTLGAKSFTSEEVLQDLYANFVTVKETLQDLKLQ